MAQQIIIDIVAETKKLTQGVDQVGKELNSIDGKLKGVASAAVAAASAFVLKQGVTFLKQGIDEAKEAQETLRAATTTFGEGSAALQKITEDAEKFGKEIAVDNDRIIELATSLGSRLPTEAQSLSAELVNLAFDVEAFTGGAVSAETVTGKLAKAFADGQVKATELQKIIPGLEQSIYDQAAALSEAGDQQGALNLLISEGQKKYGDAAESNVTASQKLDTALANLKETIGEKLLPTVEKITNFITIVIEKFSALPGPVQNVLLGFLGIVAIGGPLLGFLANAKTAMVTLGIVNTATAGTTGAATIATQAFGLALKALPILAIIGIIVLLVQNWDKVKEVVEVVWETIKKWGENVMRFMGEVWEKLKDVFGKALEFIWNAIKWYFETYKKIVETIFEAIKNVLTTVWDVIKNVFNTVLEAIKTAVTTYFNIYKTIVETVLNAIKTVIETIFNAVKAFVETIWNGIKTFFETIWNTLKTVVETGLNAIKTVIETVFNTVKDFISNVWNTIKNSISGAIDAIRNLVSDGIEKIREIATRIFNNLKDSVSGIWNSIKSTVTNLVNNIFDKISELPGKMLSVGKNIVTGLWDGIQNMAGWIRDRVSSFFGNLIPSWARGVLGINSPSKVFSGIGQNIVQGVVQGLSKPVATAPNIQIPSLSTTATKKATAPVNITINAGAGTDPYKLGRTVSTAINKYSRVSTNAGRYVAL